MEPFTDACQLHNCARFWRLYGGLLGADCAEKVLKQAGEIGPGLREECWAVFDHFAHGWRSARPAEHPRVCLLLEEGEGAP